MTAPLGRSPLWLIFGLALLLRLGYLYETANNHIWYWDTWDQTDMDTFLKVANQILSGDLLVRNPYHPIHAWHQQIGGAELWQSWYSPQAFHQVPGYNYFLALLLKLCSGSVTAIKVIQMVLGAAQAALLAAVGQRIMGGAAALIAGLLAAIYGPLIAVEPLLLREGIGLFLATLSFYLVLRCLDRSAHTSPRSAWRSWLAAGLVLGMSALMKETGFVLFVAVWLWVFGRSLRKQNRIEKTAAAFLLGGFALSLVPLMLRNLAVGAPLLAFASTFPFNFALANAADAPGGGVLFGVPASLRGIMEDSSGQLLPTIAATLKTYAGDPGQFFVNLWVKFSAIWSNVELADNFSYDYFVIHSRILGLLPRFVCIWLPALLALVLLAVGRRNTVSCSGEILSLLMVILVVHALAQSFAPVMSRYRLVIVPYLILLAAWTLAQASAWIRTRQWSSMGWVMGGSLTIWLAWLTWPVSPVLQQGAISAVDFAIGAKLMADRSGFSAARDEFEQGLAYFQTRGATDQEIGLRRERLLYYAGQGRFSEVRDDWELVRLTLPRNHPVVQAIQRELSGQAGFLP